MKLTHSEITHFKNVLWGTRFHRWFRWVLLAVLAYIVIGHFTSWRPISRVDWLVAGALYLLVAWPGLCRIYVFHTLYRLIADDPEARSQLAAAGVKEFQSDAPRERA